MNKIIECKKVNWDNSIQEVLYYAVPKKLESIVVRGNFIYVVDYDEEDMEISIFEIRKIYSKNNNLECVEVKELKKSEEMHLVSNQFFVEIKDKFIDKYIESSSDALEKYIKDTLKELNWIMYEAGFEKVDSKRQKYLENIFQTDELEEFKKNSKKMVNKWFWHFNKFELDLVYVINLYRTYNVIFEIIESNNRIKNCDKVRMKNNLYNECDKRGASIQLKGINRFKGDQSIGINISHNGEKIIFGKFTRYEFSLNFYSVWSTLNNMLTVSFIPIVILLLDNSKKIQIYLLLGLVYFITLVLSDEKQVENIVEFMSSSEEKRDIKKSYFNLFLIGSISVIQFITISIQITYTPTIVESYTNLVKYFVGDLLLSYVFFILIIASVEVTIYMVSCLTSTLFYLKKKSRLIAIVNFLFKIAFGMLATYFLYDILNIKANIEYFNQFPVRYILFGLSTFIAISFIYSSYKKMKEIFSSEVMINK